MNTFMVKRLLYKDWYFNRGIIVFYLVGGALALTMIGLGEDAVFYIGSVMLVTVLIGLGIHLTFGTVVNESKLKTLPFVMSLPISVTEYTAAKILANLSVFFLLWLIMLMASVWVVFARPDLPNGVIPFVVITHTEIFAAYVLLLGVALVAESEAWTVGAMVVCNLFFNLFVYVTLEMPAIREHMGKDQPHWNATAFQLLGLEVLVMVLALSLTFYLQSRKRDFL